VKNALVYQHIEHGRAVVISPQIAAFYTVGRTKKGRDFVSGVIDKDKAIAGEVAD